jgi:ribosomal protein L33
MKAIFDVVYKELWIIHKEDDEIPPRIVSFKLKGNPKIQCGSDVYKYRSTDISMYTLAEIRTIYHLVCDTCRGHGLIFNMQCPSCKGRKYTDKLVQRLS